MPAIRAQGGHVIMPLAKRPPTKQRASQPKRSAAREGGGVMRINCAYCGMRPISTPAMSTEPASAA